MWDSPNTTVIYETECVRIRSYGCTTACRRIPTPKKAGWNSVLFMRDGRFVRTVEGEKFLIDANHVTMVNRGDEYTVWHPDEKGDQVTEIEISPHVLSEIAIANDVNLRDADRYPFRINHCMINSKEYLLHRNIWTAAMKGNIHPIAIDEAAINLIGKLINESTHTNSVRKSSQRSSTKQAHQEIVHNVKLLLSTRFNEWIGLDKLAKEVHSSPYHLCRIFKKCTGISLHMYLNRLRLRASLEGVADPKIDLTSLALNLGFSNLAHFSSAFRNEFSIPPSKVRKGYSRSELSLMSNILKDFTLN